MIATTLSQWANRWFYNVEDSKIYSTIDSIKTKPMQFINPNGHRKDYLFLTISKSFKSGTSKILKDSVYTSKEDESPFAKSSNRDDSRLLRRQTLASKDETPQLGGRNIRKSSRTQHTLPTGNSNDIVKQQPIGANRN